MDITLRPAEQRDCRRIFTLSNQRDVRAVSISPRPIEWNEHCRWFADRLEDPCTLLLVIEDAHGDFIGQLRYDAHGERATVSISLLAECRGRGVGVSALVRGDGMAFEHWPEVRGLQAFIEPANVRSREAFSRVGYGVAGHRFIGCRRFLEMQKERVRMLGTSSKALIVAELSANHHQSLDIALESVHAAREAGADTIKIQTYTPDTITIKSDNPCFRINAGSPWDGRTLHDLYQETYTPWEWHARIQEEAEKLGMMFFSTPFDPTAVDFLETLGVPAYKIASFEITDIPLIRYVASKGKPVILSTGIATLSEIDEALQACRAEGNTDLTVLKCTSEYPALPEHANLRTIPSIREAFHVDVGLSDHTLGAGVAVAAVVLGATIVEKHIILSRSMGGPDASFSLEPAEFKQMVELIRVAEQALGAVTFELSQSVIASRTFARSLFVVEDVRAGQTFTAANVRSIRPGNGLHPRHLEEVLGHTARKDIPRGTPLSWDLLG